MRKIQLSDHFNYKQLILFTIPSIMMMIFTSIYSVVDGLFVSNYVGKTAFTSINLIYPFVQILACIGFMFGTGGSALVSKTLGEDDAPKANRIFSMLTYTALVLGVLLAVVGFVFIKPIAKLLGADSATLPGCVMYGRILLAALPAFMMQNMFQSFLVTAEKPKLGLAVTIAAGVTNMVLDALFIIVFKWGVAGAAVATILAQCVGGIIPLIYFLSKNDSLLRLGKTKIDVKAMLQTCANGSSELVSNIAMSLVSILFNYRLMQLSPENGVAAYGVVMYVGFIFVGIFLGYSIGIAPVIGFHYGAQNTDELKSLFKKSGVLIIGSGLVISSAAFAFAKPLASIFTSYDAELLALTTQAIRYFAIGVLFSGISIFGSAFFTALNDGATSAAISFLRAFLFQTAAVIILPLWFGLNGVWYATFVSEIFAAAVSVVFLIVKRKKYRY